MRLKNCNRPLGIALTCALAAGAIAYPTAARAGDEDYKSYAANMCIERSADVGNFYRYTSAIKRSGSGGDGVLFCPIVRDRWDGDHSGIMADVEWWQAKFIIRTNDTDWENNISCGVATRSFDGRQIEWQTTTTRGAGGMQDLTIELSTGEQDHYYSMTCTLPVSGPGGKTVLYGYEVQEY